jgi:hypothetical protein
MTDLKHLGVSLRAAAIAADGRHIAVFLATGHGAIKGEPLGLAAAVLTVS